LPAGELDYDAVVVGSGFGGSMVARRLAEAGWEVCVLERGQWHAPGTFPQTAAEVKRSFWDPSHALYGMFDVWSFRGLAAVVSSGMGGGSLIYANVIAPPPEGWLRVDGPGGGPWPVDERELERHFDEVRKLLNPQPYPDGEPFASSAKTEAFLDAARRAALDGQRAPLAVQFADDAGTVGTRLPFGDPSDNHYGVQRYTCEMVGECDLGCNAGAKHSLDLAILSALEARPNVNLRDLAEVRSLQRLDNGFAVELLDHSRSVEDSRVAPTSETVTCARLILCAGTLGTALLLLRSRLEFPGLSQAVGRHFSANGDYLAFAADCDPVRSTDGAKGALRGSPINASHGPVITASARGADRLNGGDGPGFHLQDGGFPSWAGWLGLVGALRRDIGLIAAGVRSMVEGPEVGDPHQNLGLALSRFVHDGGERVLPLLSLGRDTPDGRLHLRAGRLDLDWRKYESAALYARAEASGRLVAEALGGRYVDPLRFFRPITVHPLGGCAMSRDVHTGVVDPNLCVHNVPGLSVADGSVLPGPVGINPALTIAALADRHGEFLVSGGRPER
jgi:cholesterol oxidase